MARHQGAPRLTSPPVRTAAPDALDLPTLYAILRLRAEVFVVEQASPYLDLDGRDLVSTTRHCWIEHGGAVGAYLRLVEEPGGAHRIGRVVTAPAARGRGYAAALVRHAVALTGGPVILDAQRHLAAWYTSLGFTRDGPDFVEDGIPHTPMRTR